MHSGPILAYSTNEDGYIVKQLSEQLRMPLQHKNAGDLGDGTHSRAVVNRPSKLRMKRYALC